MVLSIGAPEERCRQSPERYEIPEEFGVPALQLIPPKYTSLQMEPVKFTRR
jgi:hypothetical protein